MKKIIFLIVVHLCNLNFAQITKLSSLSDSKMLDSKIVYEENDKDVFGYVILFEKDKTNAYETTFEIALLDKNLNKVGKTSFTQETQKAPWNVKLEWTLCLAKKSKESLLISLDQVNVNYGGVYQSIFNDLGTSSFRVLDLKNFTISDNNIVKNMVIQKQTEKYDVEHPKKMEKQKEGMNFFKVTKNDGFLVNDLSYYETLNYSYNEYTGPSANNTFQFYDSNFTKKWTYNISQNEKKYPYYGYSYFDGDGKDMVFKKVYRGGAKDPIALVNFEIVNSDTGKKKFDISLWDAEKTYEFCSLKFFNDKIIIYASIHKFRKRSDDYLSGKQGYVKLTFDRETGNQLGKDFFYLSTLKGKLDFDSDANVKNYGFVYFLDFQITKEGKTILIAEGYSPDMYVKILDLFVFVLDDKMNLLEFKKIDKFKNKTRLTNLYGKTLEATGSFDYMYSQKLPGDGFVFYYSDNEKLGSRAARKDPKWILGVITYIDGVFDFQKVPLTIKDGQIYPIKAKNGYVLLKEVPNNDSDKDSELRLEKINY